MFLYALFGLFARVFADIDDLGNGNGQGYAYAYGKDMGDSKSDGEENDVVTTASTTLTDVVTTASSTIVSTIVQNASALKNSDNTGENDESSIPITYFGPYMELTSTQITLASSHAGRRASLSSSSRRPSVRPMKREQRDYN